MTDVLPWYLMTDVLPWYLMTDVLLWYLMTNVLPWYLMTDVLPWYLMTDVLPWYLMTDVLPWYQIVAFPGYLHIFSSAVGRLQMIVHSDYLQQGMSKFYSVAHSVCLVPNTVCLKRLVSHHQSDYAI